MPLHFALRPPVPDSAGRTSAADTCGRQCEHGGSTDRFGCLKIGRDISRFQLTILMHVLAGLMRGRGCELDPMTTSYFLSRDVVTPSVGSGMAPWREKLFAQMHHNASGVADFLNLPSNAVVELGSKIEI